MCGLPPIPTLDRPAAAADVYKRQVFVWMERWTEGNRSQRMKLDKAPWSLHKLGRKSAKQVLWVGFAMFTGFTFVGFFSPIRELLTSVFALSLIHISEPTRPY